MVNYNFLSYYSKIFYISLCFLLVISCLGILANLVTFLIFQRKRFRTQSFSIYAKFMAFSDSIVLWSNITQSIGFIFDNSNITLVSSFFCATDKYARAAFLLLSQILLALITIDRLLTVVYPNRFIMLRRMPFQLTIIAVALTYSMTVFIMFPFNQALITQAVTNTSTTLVCYLNPSVLSITTTINLVNMLVFTLILNNSLTVAIIVSIYRSRNKVHDRANLERSNISRRDRKFALNSIALNVASFLLKSPFFIWLLLQTNVSLPADQNLMLIGITSVINMDNAIPFFINMGMNSIFRKNF